PPARIPALLPCARAGQGPRQPAVAPREISASGGGARDGPMRKPVHAQGPFPPPGGLRVGPCAAGGSTGPPHDSSILRTLSALSKFLIVASSGLSGLEVAVLAFSFTADILASTRGQSSGSACRPMARAPSRISIPLVSDVKGVILDEM